MNQRMWHVLLIGRFLQLYILFAVMPWIATTSLGNRTSSVPTVRTTKRSRFLDTKLSSLPTASTQISTEELLLFTGSARERTTGRPDRAHETTPITHLEFGENGRKYHLLDKGLVLPGRDVAKLLDDVFAKYDKRIRPFYGVEALNVKLDMLILSFGEISETSMDFSVDLYLGHFWREPRLAFGLNRTIILGGEAIDRLWVPDTFIINSVDSKVHKMMFSNKKVWIDLVNGTMMLSTRLETKNSCKLNLRNYPLDEQTCHLAFESFSYEDKDLKYEWRSEPESDIYIYDKEMAQFDIISAKRFLKHETYHSPMFSGLTATVVFHRRTMYYIFQMYIPSGCLVALSWVSFWINHEAVPARVALSITTVLTISYMRGSVNINMPRVSYLKSIDYFFLGSFVFIFMTLVEYVLVMKQARKRTSHKDYKTLSDNIPLDLFENWEKQPMVVTVSVGEQKFKFTNSIENVENGTNAGEGHTQQPKSSRARKKKSAAYRFKPWLNSRKTGNDENKHAQSLLEAIRRSFKPERGVHYLDKYSRLCFPLCYVAFLVIYFYVYQ